MKTILSLILGLFLLSPAAVKAVTYSAYLVNDPKIAIDSSYVLDLVGNGIVYASAVATYDTGTPGPKYFTDGRISTGNITVATLASLTTAYATDTITVISTSSLAGAAISYPGYSLRNGVEWKVGATTDLTATSLAAALAKIPTLTTSRVNSIITITAKSVGSYYNTIPVASNSASITVASALMTGGQDNAIVYINGIPMRANLDWYPGASSATASTSLAAAINANVPLAALLTATANSPTAGVTALVSDAVGATKNFSLISSIPTALVVSGSAMTGGSGSNYATGSPVITLPSHGFVTGLALLYTEAAGAAASPLVDQTTYYAIRTDNNSMKLALSSLNAIAGTAITMTATPTSGHEYLLSPTAIGGTSLIKWQYSDLPTSGFTDMPVDQVSIPTYGALPATKGWNLDASKRYVKLALTAPTSGALNLKVLVQGLPLSEFARTAGDVFTGQIIHQNAPVLLTGVNGYLTASSTITALQFVGPMVGNATSATTATNLAVGAANQVPYQAGAGATTFITAPGANMVLAGNSGAPGWTTSPTVGSISVTTITFPAGGRFDYQRNVLNNNLTVTSTFTVTGAASVGTTLTVTGALSASGIYNTGTSTATALYLTAGLNGIHWADGSISTTAPVGPASISGLTVNTIPKATAANALGNSSITDNGTTVAIGTPAISGYGFILSNPTNDSHLLINTDHKASDASVEFRTLRTSDSLLQRWRIGANTIAIDNTLEFNDLSAGGVARMTFAPITGAVAIPGNSFSVGGSTLVVAGGHVGIGASPNSTSGRMLFIQGAASGEQLQLSYNGSTSSATYMGQKSNGDFQMYVYNGASYKNIILGMDGTTPAGNVGIGTTVPVSKLTVSSGTLTVDGNTTLAIDLSQGGNHTLRQGLATKAQLKALAPGSLYEYITCTDCTTATVMMSTGTSAGNWCKESDRTAALGAW